jgi:hypothetical protein
VASLCFIASRCSVFPELHELREIFAVKYGSEFVISAQELKHSSHVNRSVCYMHLFRVPRTCKLRITKWSSCQKCASNVALPHYMYKKMLLFARIVLITHCVFLTSLVTPLAPDSFFVVIGLVVEQSTP